MYGSTSPCFSPQARANALARSRLTRSARYEVGTVSGRTGSKWPGTQFSAGVLVPTPRGSKPITSYWAATFFGSDEATNPAMDRPLPPGPPGLTSSGPWDFFAVCGTRDRASVIWRPEGRRWSSGARTFAHWSLGELSVGQSVHFSFGAGGALAAVAAAGPGAAVSRPATVAPTATRIPARFVMGPPGVAGRGAGSPVPAACSPNRGAEGPVPRGFDPYGHAIGRTSRAAPGLVPGPFSRRWHRSRRPAVRPGPSRRVVRAGSAGSGRTPGWRPARTEPGGYGAPRRGGRGRSRTRPPTRAPDG